jgi:hypothetical protein
MAKQTIKSIATNITLYGCLVVIGALCGQFLGRVVTGHSFFAHASGQAGTAADTEQRPEGLGPCNCPLCCHG